MTWAALVDGTPRQLDPQVIEFDRLVGWIVAGSVSAAVLMVVLVLWLTTTPAEWVWHALGLVWVVVTATLAWVAQEWPERAYAHTSYVVEERGIEIRSGVYWRRVAAVPRSRVQHIDVTQGPIQRTYQLATLVIYTAGTEFSVVRLSGLSHRTALALRDVLLPKAADDGV